MAGLKDGAGTCVKGCCCGGELAGGRRSGGLGRTGQVLYSCVWAGYWWLRMPGWAVRIRSPGGDLTVRCSVMA